MTDGPMPNVADPQRLAAVEATGLLDTPQESAFDDLTALAAQLTGAPFAFSDPGGPAALVLESRQGVGTDGPTQNLVEDSFCQYVIASGEPFIAGDVRADPPVSVARGLERHDHVEQIAPGETLLLYTDGLVETRGDAIDTGLDRLVRVLDSLAGDGLDAMLNALLAGMVGVAPADDVALIAVRFHPEDRPRPAEAGRATD